jgi:hypothetical protein
MFLQMFHQVALLAELQQRMIMEMEVVAEVIVMLTTKMILPTRHSFG